MTGVHLYCMVPAGHAPPSGCSGVDGAAVRLIDAGALGIWVSAHAARPAAAVDAARAHNEVVAAAMDRAVTPVPARFGQWFPDENSAAAQVAGEAGRWLERLAALAGHAEYGIRVVEDVAAAAPDVHGSASVSGTEYMQELARRRARQAERQERGARLARRIASRAAGLVTETSVETAETGTLLSVAHLVAWNAAEAYHSAMRGLQGECGDLRFVFSGPWPPWSFAG